MIFHANSTFLTKNCAQMELKERINYIIDYYSLTPSKFADLIGVQRSNISHILAGRNKPSLDFVLKVLEQFPGINSDWLVRGIGEVKITDVERSDAENYQLDTLSFEGDAAESISDSPQLENSALTEHQKINIPTNDSREAQRSNSSPQESTQKTNAVNIQHPSTTKKTTRIIVFYDDNSFDEFLPN